MNCQMNTLAYGTFSAIAASSSPLAGGDIYHGLMRGACTEADCSVVINENRDALGRNLFDCWESAMRPGWDGHDAPPLPYETLQHAMEFAGTLPWNAAIPELAAESDGCISFDWYQDEYNQLSISIDAEGLVSYASRVGGDARFGSYRLDGTRRLPLDLQMSVNDLAA